MNHPFHYAVVVNPGGVNTVSAFNPHGDRAIYTADGNHPHYDRIVKGLEDGDSTVWQWFDIGKAAVDAMQQVTERVTWDGAQVYFDGDPIHNVLADQLHRVLVSGDTSAYTALAKFWEKLASNPSEHSREQAYDWLACHKFQITADGDVVGYKGVYHGTNAETGDYFTSTQASQTYGKPSAFVNGVALPERVKVHQRVGDTVTMPRNEVVHDPSKACHRGLHVATHSYATSYGSKLLRVLVNPRDICSVPTQDKGVKVRVNRYYVDAVVDKDGAISDAPVLSKADDDVAWVPDVGYKGW